MNHVNIEEVDDDDKSALSPRESHESSKQQQQQNSIEFEKSSNESHDTSRRKLVTEVAIASHTEGIPSLPW